MLNPGQLFGANDRELGLSPYGDRWIQYHDHTRSTMHTIHIYRDMLDRLMPEQCYN
ncbi:hypothetical protein ACS0TY_004175 [Phlomoides rotata]